MTRAVSIGVALVCVGAMLLALTTSSLARLGVAVSAVFLGMTLAFLFGSGSRRRV
jgi:hypothetical protein